MTTPAPMAERSRLRPPPLGPGEGPFRFLSLPLELRNEVYRALLAPTAIIYIRAASTLTKVRIHGSKRMVPSYEVTGRVCEPGQLAQFRELLVDELESTIINKFKELRSDRLQPHIFYVNRQVLHEAAEILYRDNLFVFQDPLQAFRTFLAACQNMLPEICDTLPSYPNLASSTRMAQAGTATLAMCSEYPHFNGFKAQWHWSYVRQLATLLASGNIHTLRIVYPPVVISPLDQDSTEEISDEAVKQWFVDLVGVMILCRRNIEDMHVIKMLMMPRAEGDEEMESRIRARLDKPEDAQALCAEFGKTLEARELHDFVVTREVHRVPVAGSTKRGYKPVLVLRRRGGAIGNSKMGLHME
ncbi:hypothetical protein H2201_004585 [Coniosporium apollinis]|uniref:F-box domain-containing protein n=1 Tax=Coniosporium apollinis TaxID=61459 RepID=A0ABQ9NTR9_9PEZI|nr:hypothetical protein H2201_004585 [Coniosporium apollinis]